MACKDEEQCQDYETRYASALDRTLNGIAGKEGFDQEYQKDQFSSVAHSCPTLCDPVVCSMPGLPVHHQLPEFIQTHVH